MPTNTDRINSLTETAATHAVQIDAARLNLAALQERLTQCEKANADLRTEMALARLSIDDLKRQVETWTNRWWTLLAGLLIALIGIVFQALRK